jgi:hypothetical protein
MQEEVVTADSAKKKDMEGEMKMEGMDLQNTTMITHR